MMASTTQHILPKTSAGGFGLLDRTGVVLSLACGLHCLLTPLLIGAAAALPIKWLASETAEFWLFSGSVAVAAASVLPSYWVKHRRKGCLVFLSAGLVVLGLLTFGSISEQLEPWIVAGGAFSITVAHLVNIRLCRECAHCRAEGEAS